MRKDIHCTIGGVELLHEKYGNYEEEGKSMRDIVTEHYGEKGMKMILNLIG